MSDVLFSGVNVFDGSGGDVFSADVRVSGNRIVGVTSPGADAGSAKVIEGRGATLMPGLIEAHAHLDFGASVDRIPPNPFALTPADRMLAAVHAARTFMDYGYTSAYSAGCMSDAGAEVALKREIDAGHIPGPRMVSCSSQWMPGLSLPGTEAPFGVVAKEKRTPNPQSARDFVAAMADAGVEIIKLGLNGESGLIPGTSRSPLFYEEELEAAMDAVRKAGLVASAHVYADEEIRMALRHGVRVLYHCAFMDEATIDLVEAARDDVFVAPGPGVLWATIHAPPEMGLTPEVIEKMEAQVTLDASKDLMPKLKARGIRVLPGGDYGFAMNPIGKNARDLSLFVTEYAFSPSEALHAATGLGGEIMNMADELGLIKPGYLTDLLLVDGAPLSDIEILQDRTKLRVVMKDGQFHKGGV